MNQATKAQRELALRIYDSDANDVQIDDSAFVYENDEGIWIQAWLFVSNESMDSNFGAL